ncbi:2-amino-4-hydroxy-6-hydroxymethyldihydropteridine diphosphokinase [Dokdonella sp.]|uniref:2-amino-4-hydroxy-6- hydroxymethyldihydropteridine diphosphokinase n=1 Tax=Dokdonella sp. TaxID=2291710 RepID=UPI001B0E6A6A|nr:2-amino-4-hydroxy-6-hydroxymethyldihydropteridine diphosphokinase [Dokdonella sp.]MBO9662380.1 2-amino-4-hydroxy-6-hydroxymethyldihydropteridine diphosphokinase [Dokdonella sp.]
MSEPETTAYVGLGSNLDGPEQRVRHALNALGTIERTRLVRHSRLYRTAPWGRGGQPDFINAAAQLSTALSPRELLDALLALEIEQGRHRDGSRWGPRTLDLDLLVHGEARIAEPGLALPHPHIAERAFVLLPLAEIAPELVIPGVGRVRELSAGVDARGCALLEQARARTE